MVYLKTTSEQILESIDATPAPPFADTKVFTRQLGELNRKRGSKDHYTKTESARQQQTSSPF